MKKQIQFVFGLHDHQPVGNFDHVFADAYDRAYLPFLELLETFSRFRVGLHHSGPLLQWIQKNRPEYFERLGTLVTRRQVELLGGAFYEPILPILPEKDQLGQILAMSDWIEERFAVRPRGAWLAERVWEPTLPSVLHRAGIEYTVIDDSHFKSVGIPETGTFGYYLTEDRGHPLAVFPINERMRYTIPYLDPDETFDYLRGHSTDQAVRTVVMADDGEKFGVWPEMFQQCWEEGWMYRFVEKLLNNRDWIKLRTFGEVLDETAPLGQVYLPAASYVEMMEWAMPPASQARYHEFVESLKSRGDYDGNKTFVRGGFWRSFLSRYSESNHLHKRMLRLSRRLWSVPEDLRDRPPFLEARDHLWQSQCNCAYWHGVFGGLYLTNLRNALYKHLIEGERCLDELTRPGKSWIDFSPEDFDLDGGAELILETPAQNLIFKPHEGGSLVEQDLPEFGFNILDTLMRRPEYYHEALSWDPQTGLPKLEEFTYSNVNGLAFDWYRRGSLIDHFLDQDATPENFRLAVYPEMGDFVGAEYECVWSSSDSAAKVTFRRDGHVETGDGSFPVRVEKGIAVSPKKSVLTITYRLKNLSKEALATRFGVEFNVNLLAGDAPDRYHVIEGINLGTRNKMLSTGLVANVTRFAVVDEWQGLRASWELSRPAQHWRLPIETMANSVEGAEKIYQSTVLMPVWRLNLPGHGRFEVKIRYAVEKLS